MQPIARQDGLSITRAGDDTVVYDERRKKAHALHAAAALVFAPSAGETTVPELAALLHRELGRPADPDLVWFAPGRLERARLLREAVRRPDGRARPTRRRVLAKLGAASGRALLLPAVESIVAPTPAKAFSF